MLRSSMKNLFLRAMMIGALMVVFCWNTAMSLEYRFSVDDYVSLKINNTLIASYDAYPWGVAEGTVNFTEGWYPIELIYKNRWGSTAFRFYEREDSNDPWGIVPLTDLRSLDGSGALVQGLRADYYTLGGSFLGTLYGEGPIEHGWLNLYEGVTGQWGNGIVDTNWGDFEERLTGEIFVSSAAVPTPEPSTWCLFLAGLIGLVAVRRQRSGS
ncbi:PEP-CTERM sorting domain-containing protein [Geobacter sp.]|uniref:PEP-CTERM sorting domain-containing protein n=1 Tax=Geobacter sp. TaxID=46610 RepID=UPI001AC67979|nr:PEP-CTERM sorting domain-containing protein [Geobacter sp.]CAG0947450.1 hypothetical protein ANRL1_04131 [Anaerolineae bacterium]